ncbi:MAG: hypothetical protein JWQ91_1050 [Aeromicrobium sp.]|jgi:ribosomal-protein-alanine N-acetyltransferase|uniref:GNAT family N-acetyltransferase n=1 Tax=Aeromicrobium sp. TaxID=1871063 RepID=UPI0026350552|nr:GNAT family N-acetyltransferase [Aeromicrobium sp.]MCW2824133.1 hypothetical protein [Aeromicrobium sp.]
MSDLRLVPLSLAVFEALAAEDRAAAAELLGLPIPVEFAEAVDIWRFMIRVVAEDPDNADWAMQAVVVGADTIVGNAGFKGAPASGQAELGYRIVASHRRRRFAVGAIQALLEHARAEPRLDRVIARISPDNDASVGVVTAAGFVPDGEWMNPRWGRQLQFVTDVATPE